MAQKKKSNFLGSETEYVDILFVTNQSTMPAQVEKLLADNGFTWVEAGVDRFADSFDDTDIIGTVVVETSDFRQSQRKKFLDVIRRIDRAGVATVLLNNHIDFPFEEFRLAGLLQSSSLGEMLGRIAANVAYKRTLPKAPAEQSGQKPPLAADTAEQLRMAGEVQRNFLPDTLPNSETVRWATIFHPADWVSGDIYDIRRLDEQHIGFYIADAVGHSMPAALLTMFLKEAIIMRQTSGNSYRIFEPVEVMENLNKKMAEQHLKGCLFATCCYCLLNTQTLKMTYARAGHPYPVLLRKAAEPEQLENRGGLLGVFDETDFEQKTVQLEQGDKLLMYSDGCDRLIGRDTEHGYVFSEELCSVSDLSVGEMFEAFEVFINNQVVLPGEVDDITAIGLEISGG